MCSSYLLLRRHIAAAIGRRDGDEREKGDSAREGAQGMMKHSGGAPLDLRLSASGSILLAICGVTMALVGAVAIGEALGLVEVPAALADGVARRLPLTFSLHMAAGGLGLLLAPLAIALAALTAVPVALASDANITARAGFLVQALAWLGCLVAGVRAIRGADTAAHRAAMLLATAIASGATVQRLMLWARAVFWPWSDFDAAYGAIVWASWLAPLAATGVWLARDFRSKT